MHVLSDSVGSKSGGVLSGQEDDVGGFDGGEGSSIYNGRKDEEFRLIKIANRRISLQSVFARYSLQFEQRYNTNGWTHVCMCPFEDHNDKHPSFGYNREANLFNCFGCQRGGGPVQFIAYMEGMRPINVAKMLMDGSVPEEELEKFNEESIDYDRLDRLLFGFADYVYKFKLRHDNSDIVIQYADDVCWSLDVYLMKHAKYASIILDDLEVRIEKLKEQIDAFQEG